MIIVESLLILKGVEIIMSVLIYQIDSSKLVPIGEEGYQKGQEQAKIYFDEMPKGDFTVAITGEETINKLGVMADLDLRGNNRILVSVDNEDAQRIGMTIYYYDRQAEAAKHSTVSHVNCKEESDYELAKQMMGFIEEAFYAGKDKKLDFYKKRLESECGQWGRFRFNAIEFMCSAPGIDPVEMAVALKKDGFEVVFDDSSISRGENVRKRNLVEKRFAEETTKNSLDELIADAEGQKKGDSCGVKGFDRDFDRE